MLDPFRPRGETEEKSQTVKKVGGEGEREKTKERGASWPGVDSNLETLQIVAKNSQVKGCTSLHASTDGVHLRLSANSRWKS